MGRDSMVRDLIGENTVVYKMPRKVKNLCSSTLPLDVLSNLPAHVLDDILICLPFRDAVRTSILSNKWRFNWCRLPALMLDQTLWDTTNENINFVTRFTDIIYHIMAFHVGPITKFILSIADMENYPKVDYLVSFLSRNGSVDIAAKLSSPLNCLKSLCLSGIYLDESVELFVALCLIRSSPYLQDIQMKFDYSDELFFPLSGDVISEIPASFTDVTLNHLRSVKLEGISGTKTEIEFINLLLAKSQDAATLSDKCYYFSGPLD
ncbi:hypothetical protein BC332_27412 [Capsicum chinense]|nr:hypothetical protein BC332_27412 [Capsicum chinense]